MGGLCREGVASRRTTAAMTTNHDRRDADSVTRVMIEQRRASSGFGVERPAVVPPGGSQLGSPFGLSTGLSVVSGVAADLHICDTGGVLDCRAEP